MITKSEKQTIALGEKFAQKLKGGEVILLLGDLGAGKTTFVKGVARGFKIKKNITSPTFVLMKVYNIKGKIKNLVHIDTYRGIDLPGLMDIGALEYFGQPDAVCFVEWGSGLENYLAENKIKYHTILFDSLNEKERQVNIN